VAQRQTIPFIGQTAQSRSLAVNNQKTVNLMQAMKSGGAKSQYVLESVPGLVDLYALGDGPIRSGKMVSSDIRVGALGPELYGVFGTKLTAQTPTLGNFTIGTLNANPGRVRMARGRTHVAMVDGLDGYTYDGTTFAQITDLDFPGNAGRPNGKPTHLIYLDGFFIVNDADTDDFLISGLEDPTDWNPLDFDVASVAPDNSLALAATESLLWIQGDETSQAYYNSGNADFPYEIVLNATQEVGILAPQSIAESDDGIFYLATTPEGGRFVYQIKGTTGRVITEDEQEAFLTTVDDPTDAYAFIYKQAGKSFYVLQLSANGPPEPRTSSTLIYNIRAGRWETRELQDGTAWRAGGHGILDNRNIVGSRIAARALELDLTVFTDSGAEIIRSRRTQIYHLHNYLMDWWALVVDVEPGVGNVVAPGEDPQLLMRYSDDGGINWSAFLKGSVGKIGETLQRVVYRNLGQARNRVFEIKFSDPVALTVVAAYAELEVLGD
jgi:hypothetical protein